MLPNDKKIKARIVELGLTIREVSIEMGLTAYTLGRKISGKTPMTLREARSLQSILGISDDEIPLYFFTRDVA